MKKTAWLLSLLIASSICQAQEIDEIEEEEISRYGKHHIALQGALGSNNYGLEGAGVSIDASDDAFVTYGLDTKYQSKNFSWNLSYHISESNYDSPTGITPTGIKTTEDRLIFSVGNKIFKNSFQSMSDVEFTLGYYIQSRSAERTAPTDVFLDSDKTGFTLGFNLFRPLAKDFAQNFETNFFFINTYKESPTNNGYYEMGYEIDIKYRVFYPISRFVDLSLGAFVNYGKIDFNGTGDRGITGVSETELKYGVPLEIWILF